MFWDLFIWKAEEQTADWSPQMLWHKIKKKIIGETK